MMDKKMKLKNNLKKFSESNASQTTIGEFIKEPRFLFALVLAFGALIYSIIEIFVSGFYQTTNSPFVIAPALFVLVPIPFGLIKRVTFPIYTQSFVSILFTYLLVNTDIINIGRASF